MRGMCFDAGYVYTRFGIYDRETKQLVNRIKEEHDIFNLIGIDYIPPENR